MGTEEQAGPRRFGGPTPKEVQTWVWLKLEPGNRRFQGKPFGGCPIFDPPPPLQRQMGVAQN